MSTIVPVGPTTTISGSAAHVDLGSYPVGTVSIAPGTDISGGGQDSDGVGQPAIYSNTGGITLRVLQSDLSKTSILGSNGADQTSSSAAGAGGIGVNLQASDLFFNAGSVSGGDGGASLSSSTPGGSGGAGVVLAQEAYLSNAGSVAGGASHAGAGGDGVDVAADQGYGANGTINTDLYNTGAITGGDGATVGGIGVSLLAKDIGYNTGTIQGGNGIAGDTASGGVGLSIEDGTTFVSGGGSIQGGMGSGTGSGGAGVYIGGSGTTLEAVDTTITGGSGTTRGDAVEFSATGSGSLVLGANDTIDGAVVASYGADDTLSLQQSGTLTGGLGTQFTGFSHLDFGSGASWTVDTTAAGLSNLKVISGFSSTDTLDVTDLPLSSATSSSYVTNSIFTVTSTNSSTNTEDGTLTVTTSTNGQSSQFNLQFTGLALGTTLQSFQASADPAGTGTDITLVPEAACFVRGTRIRTTRGEVPIEELVVSDKVLCSGGETRPVRWVGHRSIDCSRHPDPASVWPVCILAGALGDQQPVRDLWVSPGHCVLVAGVLVQAEKLVNGVTVRRVPRPRVDYWHVELDAHDVLFSEGLATESYLDTGNRGAFFNGGAFLEAHPDFRPKHWSETCVPLAMEGPALQAARAQVLERTRVLGYEITGDVDLHVLADGERIEPVSLGGQRVAFMLPARRKAIELRCRTFIPAHVDAASGDGRELGLCVGRLQVDGTDWALSAEVGLAEGWHALEQFASGHVQRWTTGCTQLPEGTRLIVIDVAGRSYCWREPREAAALFG